MNRIAVAVVTFLLTLAAVAAAVFLTFGVHKSLNGDGIDGYLLLFSEQSQKCADGGGRATYSKAEFEAAINQAIMYGLTMRRQSWRDGA